MDKVGWKNLNKLKPGPGKEGISRTLHRDIRNTTFGFIEKEHTSKKRTLQTDWKQDRNPRKKQTDCSCHTPTRHTHTHTHNTHTQQTDCSGHTRARCHTPKRVCCLLHVPTTIRSREAKTNIISKKETEKTLHENEKEKHNNKKHYMKKKENINIEKKKEDQIGCGSHTPTRVCWMFRPLSGWSSLTW